ncbi:hypothetical protein DQW77_01755 [Roseovarius sp. TE539]|uniref:DUF6902 family protein n=1 Tax=Roseovarius sp. TE539 TaxID=2249812 RepID=UPI000DDCDC66|nr:hypothetical protein [Roseovarius sp. TE539]RBI77185.1 hypothetical protein DQW77_01755 [Roseovarius sp. TE539]
MENVVQLNVPFRQHSSADRQAALMACFAQHRRFGDDVFWLKENAELLNIMESTGAEPDGAALSVHDEFYHDIEKRMGFFPQYYRFLLSLCLDLEDLGMPGEKGAQLAHWVGLQGLAEAELSDLQRAEARRLCARRDVDPMADDTGLDDRLRRFARRCETFSMPNKKAAYELTHIVFYLSEYGRRDPVLDAETLDSLSFAGTLAFLDLNVDLLAEICIALRFAGQEPPQIWENWLVEHAATFALDADPQVDIQDDYHEFLMCNWFMGVSGRGGFAQQIAPGRVAFRGARPGSGPLRELSECMYRMDGTRSGDWQVMRSRVADRLSNEAQAVLIAAEAANESFDRFFAGFARVGLQGAEA